MDAISSAAFTFSRLDTTKTNNTFITQLLEISYAPSNYSEGDINLHYLLLHCTVLLLALLIRLSQRLKHYCVHILLPFGLPIVPILPIKP